MSESDIVDGRYENSVHPADLKGYLTDVPLFNLQITSLRF
jgi:hypothetical protein